MVIKQELKGKVVMKPITKCPVAKKRVPKVPKMDLLTFMAQACHYAQSHCGAAYAWSKDKGARENLLECTSFQMACFIAQNTIEGNEVVEWNVILESLIDNETDRQGMMCKSIAEWKKILQTIVDEYGGWK